MKATFAGGYFQGTSRIVPVDTLIWVHFDKSGSPHLYLRALGTSYGRGADGRWQEEEAIFFDQAVFEDGIAAMLHHLEATHL